MTHSFMHRKVLRCSSCYFYMQLIPKQLARVGDRHSARSIIVDAFTLRHIVAALPPTSYSDSANHWRLTLPSSTSHHLGPHHHRNG